MKILFKNTTQYTTSIYNTFLTFHSQKYKFKYTAYNVLVIGFILFTLILQVSHHNFSIAILLCSGLTFFILWRFFHPIVEVSKEYKSDKFQKEKKYTFKFYEKFFTVEDEKEIYKIGYYQLYRIFETSGFFYLYVDPKHSFLIDKTKFKNNQFNEFSAFIKKKCWWKYKLYN